MRAGVRAFVFVREVSETWIGGREWGCGYFGCLFCSFCMKRGACRVSFCTRCRFSVSK